MANVLCFIPQTQDVTGFQFVYLPVIYLLFGKSLLEKKIILFLWKICFVIFTFLILIMFVVLGISEKSSMWH